jgi:hypothetical protein
MKSSMLLDLVGEDIGTTPNWPSFLKPGDLKHRKYNEGLGVTEIVRNYKRFAIAADQIFTGS